MALAIIAATFIHEDIATVATGILVADGVTSVGVALPALYIGIVAGDLGLYGFGRLIALNRISKRLADGQRFSAFKIWLDERLVAGVFMVRFLPGLRMTAYTTYGFFAMPFRPLRRFGHLCGQHLDDRAVLSLLSVRSLDRGMARRLAVADHHHRGDRSAPGGRTPLAAPRVARRA